MGNTMEIVHCQEVELSLFPVQPDPNFDASFTFSKCKSGEGNLGNITTLKHLSKDLRLLNLGLTGPVYLG